LLLRNAAIVDVGWAGPGLATLAIFYACIWTGIFRGANGRWRRWPAFWDCGWRFICFFRACLASPEEGRYIQFAAANGRRILPYASWFFSEFQAVLTVVLSLPFLLASLNPAAPLSRLEKIGAAIWLVSICGEAVAITSLNRFRKNPENRGKTYRRGCGAIHVIRIIFLSG